MSYDQTNSLKGSNKTYQLNPSVKKYSLRDVGFQETKNGNFQYVRSLSTTVNPNQGAQFKVVVAKTLDSFRMSTTSANGLKTINLYELQNMEPAIEMVEYTIANFVERGILEEV